MDAGKPGIVVSSTDYYRLVDLASGVLKSSPDIAEQLQSEMDRAEVVSVAHVPANVVRMKSTVEFRSNDGKQRRVTLVFPKDADITENRISVLTPIGVALIGLAVGQSITWKARDGREHTLTVLGVEHDT